MIVNENNFKLQETYDARATDKQIQVNAKFAEHPAEFSIVLLGSDKTPDCKISSFTANIWFRTRKGENREQYTSFKGLERAIENKAKQYGYTLEKLIITKGEPNRL